MSAVGTGTAADQSFVSAGPGGSSSVKVVGSVPARTSRPPAASARSAASASPMPAPGPVV